VKAGRTRPVRLLEKLLESRFALWRTLQKQQHARRWKRIRNRAQIEPRLRQRVNISFQRHPKPIVNWLRDA
jgi:hypothetical protein